MRFLFVGLAFLATLASALETTDCRAVPKTFTSTSGGNQRLKLQSVDCPPGTRFYIESKPARESGASGAAASLSADSKLEEKESPVRDVVRASHDTSIDADWGAGAMTWRNIYPQAGDLPGAWVTQTGSANWAVLSIPAYNSVDGIDIYETLNPGGVVRVDLMRGTSPMAVYSTKASDTAYLGKNAVKVTYEDGKKDNGDKTGARKMMIRFPKSSVGTVTEIRLTVDASKEWRGIDFVAVHGLTQVDFPLPGPLEGNEITFKPGRAYGCDTLKYRMQKPGRAKELTAPVDLKVCFGCPSNNGKACNGHGTCSWAKCACHARWEGVACQQPQCPASGGKMCGGRGTCSTTTGTCDCHWPYTGAACTQTRLSSSCHWVGDPHWATFDHRWTSHGTYYNNYEPGEWLDFYDPDVHINPTHEVIGHGQRRPYRHSVVTGTTYVVFRKGQDFVKVSDPNDVRYGRHPGCYGGNLAHWFRAHGSNGWKSTDGLQVRWLNGQWYVSSTVGGKRPSYTTLVVRGRFMWTGTWIYVHTPPTGRLKGMCGNFDRKGMDFKRWRHNEPANINSLRIPGHKALASCKAPMQHPLLEESMLETDDHLYGNASKDEIREANQHALEFLQEDPRFGLRNHLQARYVAHAEQVTALAAVTSPKLAKTHERVLETLTQTDAAAASNDADETDDVEDERRDPEIVAKATAACKGKTFAADAELPTFMAKVDKTWLNLALGSCTRGVLHKVRKAIADEGHLAKSETDVKAAQALVNKLDDLGIDFDDEVDDYVKCLFDACTTGKEQDWEDVVANDIEMEKEAEEEDNVDGVNLDKDKIVKENEKTEAAKKEATKKQ